MTSLFLATLAWGQTCEPVTGSELSAELPTDWDGWGALHHRLERCPGPEPLPVAAIEALYAVLVRLAREEGLEELAVGAERARLGAAPARWRALEAPAWVDGRWQRYVPTDRPVLVQEADPDGRVLRTTLTLGPGPEAVAPRVEAPRVLAVPRAAPAAPEEGLSWRSRWGGPALERVRPTVFVRAGWALGRLQNRFTTLSWDGGTATWDRLDEGSRPVVDVGGTLELASWLEVGIAVGLYGWQQVEDASSEADGSGLVSVVVQDTGIGGVEAFSRLRPLSFGPLSWYAAVGLSTRFYDGDVAGWVWSPTVGPGLLVDLGSSLRLGLEVSVAPWGALDTRTGDAGAPVDALTAEGVSQALWVRTTLGLAWRL